VSYRDASQSSVGDRSDAAFCCQYRGNLFCLLACRRVSAGDKYDENMVTNAIVQYSGEVLWMYPALLTTHCTLNVEYFPFDTQKCEIVFISWTFSGLELNISVREDFRNAVYYESENKVTFELLFRFTSFHFILCYFFNFLLRYRARGIRQNTSCLNQGRQN